MKQGTGNSRMGSQKVEPRSRAINPGAVSEMGTHQVHIRAKPAMVEGRGYKAPMAAASNHKSGSQGKH